MARPDEETSVLFVNLHYAPDVAATGQRLTDLAEWLAAEGVEVEVWAGQGGYTGDRVDAPARENRNGVRVRRFSTFGLGRGSHLKRVADYGAFFVQVLARLLLRPRWDLVVFLTTPSLLPVAGLTASLVRGQSYAVWSMDLHPEAEVAVGALPEGAVTDGLKRLDAAAYRRAEFVVALGPCMKRRILSRGVPDERVYTIPVWARSDEVQPVVPADNELRRDLGFEDDFVVMYSGNAGLGHRFGEVLSAADRLRNQQEIQFLFVGSGPRRGEIEQAVQERGLSNVTYLDYFPRDVLSQSLSIGDVHLLTLRREMAGVAVPSKLFGIMAAGRPVLMVGPEESDPGRIVTQHRIGYVIDPDQEDEPAEVLVEKILELRDDSERSTTISRRSRRVFLEDFERNVCCRRWSNLIALVTSE